METKQRVALFIVGIIAVVLIGILALVVGNAGVRRVQPSGDVTIQLQEPVVPGVLTRVQWTNNEGLSDRIVNVTARLNGVDQVLTSGQLFDGFAMIVFPCSVTTRKGSLNLVDQVSGEVLTWMQVGILPPGPDCL